MQHVRTFLFGVCLLATAVVPVQTALGASNQPLFGAPSENDTLYRLSNAVAVYTHRGFQTTLDSLKKGQRVAYDVQEDTQDLSRVTVIWILSKR
jgi:hypothetical protein